MYINPFTTILPLQRNDDPRINEITVYCTNIIYMYHGIIILYTLQYRCMFVIIILQYSHCGRQRATPKTLMPDGCRLIAVIIIFVHR